MKKEGRYVLSFLRYHLVSHVWVLFYVLILLNSFIFQKALITAKHMLELWKTLYEGQTSSDVPECDRKSDSRSVFQLYTSEMSDKDSSKLLFNPFISELFFKDIH